MVPEMRERITADPRTAAGYEGRTEQNSMSANLMTWIKRASPLTDTRRKLGAQRATPLVLSLLNAPA